MGQTLSDRQLVNHGQDELTYAVEQWSRDGITMERVLSRNGTHLIAKAAYDRACAAYPNVWLVLREGTRVIELRKAPPR